MHIHSQDDYKLHVSSTFEAGLTQLASLLLRSDQVLYHSVCSLPHFFSLASFMYGLEFDLVYWFEDDLHL